MTISQARRRILRDLSYLVVDSRTAIKVDSRDTVPEKRRASFYRATLYNNGLHVFDARDSEDDAWHACWNHAKGNCEAAMPAVVHALGIECKRRWNEHLVIEGPWIGGIEAPLSISWSATIGQRPNGIEAEVGSTPAAAAWRLLERVIP